MKTEFRNRAFLPMMMPLGIVLFIAAFVGLFAWILLYNTKDGALALAAVMATGILVSIALAATADEEEMDIRRKAGVGLAMVVPILVGIGLAGTGGGVEDSALLNINREEISVVPETNVTVVATNSLAFEQTELVLPSGEEVAIIFDNREATIPHNVAVKSAPALGEAPDLSNPLAASPITPGPDETFVSFTLDPGAYYYWCQVHPGMNGFIDAAEGAEPSGGAAEG